MKEIKRCGSRNCNAVLIGKRKGAKYCSRQCKEYERVASKREKKRIKEDKDHLKYLINQYEKGLNDQVGQDVLDLYKLVYGKS